MNILLETPVFTVVAALKAAEFGADRLELCSSFYEGGETPGPGFLSFLKETIDIPVFVMIRPRGGNFVYTDEELEVMKREITQFSNLGADGFVFGVLKQDGNVHEEACRSLVEVAGEKPCTFHRAFDVCSGQEKALEEIVECGFKRILTSGGKNSVKEGLPQIIRLLELAGDRIIIMPGGGMKPELVAPLRKTGYLKEIHASCKTIRPAERIQTNSEVKLTAGEEESGVLTVDKSLFEKFRKAVS
jgi:copper homeostasis protein